MSISKHTFDEPKPLPRHPSDTKDKTGKFERIGDAGGRDEIYLKALSDYDKDSGYWDVLARRADEGRKGSNNYEAAYLYLAMAKILTERSKKKLEKEREASAYHNAGHAFRECGQLNRAGDAYWRSGYVHCESKQKARSFSRAKACYTEVGDIEGADKMHRCEWQARRDARKKSLTLWIWFVASGYGTSVKRWIVCLAIFLGLFTATYQVLETAGVIKAQTADWIVGLSAFYFTVTTSVTLDHVLISGWVSTLLVLLNLVLANVLLAVGATLLGQKILRR